MGEAASYLLPFSSFPSLPLPSLPSLLSHPPSLLQSTLEFIIMFAFATIAVGSVVVSFLAGIYTTVAGGWYVLTKARANQLRLGGAGGGGGQRRVQYRAHQQ